MIFLVLSQSYAQDRDLITINYSISKLKYNDTTADSRLLDLKFRIPVYHKESHTFLASLNYKYLALDHFPASYSDNLQVTSVQFLYNKKLSATKNISVFGQFGLFSDFKDLNGKDYRYGFGINYNIKHNTNLSMGWGILYARQFFGSQIVPFINIDYQISKKWKLSGQLPVKEKLLYQINPKISAGIELNGQGSSYRLSENANQNNYVKIIQWDLLSKFEYQFAKSWQLNLGIGSNLTERYQLYEDSTHSPLTIITIPLGRKAEPLQEIKSKGFTAQLGVSYGIFK